MNIGYIEPICFHIKETQESQKYQGIIFFISSGDKKDEGQLCGVSTEPPGRNHPVELVRAHWANDTLVPLT